MFTDQTCEWFFINKTQFLKLSLPFSYKNLTPKSRAERLSFIGLYFLVCVFILTDCIHTCLSHTWDHSEKYYCQIFTDK